MADPILRSASNREILLAIKARIEAVTGLDDSQVLVTAAEPPDVPHFKGDQDVLLRLGQETYAEGEPADGGGRAVDLRKQEVEVYCRTRLFLDSRDQDHARLTDASLGHIVLVDQVYNALASTFAFEDGPGDDLALPGRMGAVARPVKDRGNPNWISSRVDISYIYQRDLSLPEAPVL